MKECKAELRHKELIEALGNISEALIMVATQIELSNSYSKSIFLEGADVEAMVDIKKALNKGSSNR